MTCPECQGELVRTDDFGSAYCPECGYHTYPEDLPGKEIPEEGDEACAHCGNRLDFVRGDVYGWFNSTCYTCEYCGFKGTLPGVRAPVIDFNRGPCRFSREYSDGTRCTYEASGDGGTFSPEARPIDPAEHCIRCVLWRCRA